MSNQNITNYFNIQAQLNFVYEEYLLKTQSQYITALSSIFLMIYNVPDILTFNWSPHSYLSYIYLSHFSHIYHYEVWIGCNNLRCDFFEHVFHLFIILFVFVASFIYCI